MPLEGGGVHPIAYGERSAHRDYVSDPANSVPYRQRPILPTYEGGDWPKWESADQRFADHRTDVLTYVSAPLPEDLIIAGPVSATLYVSTSGTDADFVVKLIDEFPEVAQNLPWDPQNGPAPGQFPQTQNGYQLPIAMEYSTEKLQSRIVLPVISRELEGSESSAMMHFRK